MTEDQDQYLLCALPVPDPFALPADLAAPRAEAIRLNRAKWDNGTELTYHFLESPAWTWPDEQKAVVHQAFRTWKEVGIGLTFREAPQAASATILVGRLADDGSWSYVGTDVLTNRRNGCNMNFGWDLTTAWGGATALHEIGHALGMPHEHQNPKAGLVWDEAAVLAFYSGPPNNWDEPKIRNNILRKLPKQEVEGSNWDPRSVMHYPFKPKLIQAPKEWQQGTPTNFGLSDNDRIWMRRFYPSIEHAAPIAEREEAAMAAKPGETAQFVFIPGESRRYRIATHGRADARIGLFKAGNGILRPLATADDAGRDANATIATDLEQGAQYVIAARTIFADKDGVRLSVR